LNSGTIAGRQEDFETAGKDRVTMNHLNLLVKFTVAGDSRVHIKGARGIKLDGKGGLTLYNAESGEPENVCLGLVQNLSIHALPWLTAYTPATAIQ
jgi:hypothetical protein